MTAPFRINWRTCATQLALLLPRERLHPAVLAWTHGPQASAEPWVVAFSGGADSLALLMVLWSHWPERRKKLCAVHFNHCLRGAAANADERFCRTVCSALGVRYASGRWAHAVVDASEAEAREARHAFLSSQLRHWRAHALWFGHQQDDVAETMFMRLARGSGLGGLAAPRPVQSMPQGRVHLRPLLGISKATIIQCLGEAGAVWCEDESNAAGGFLRNRIRHDVIPVWQAASGNRDALTGICLSRELIEEDDTAMDSWLSEIDPISRDGSLNLMRIAGKPRGLVRRALHLWLVHHGKAGNISRQAFNTLLDDLVRHRLTRHSLDRLNLIEIGKRFARIIPAPRKISK